MKTKKTAREIEAAAIALGFPRQVSRDQVERELARAAGARKVDRPRFLALASLCLLMEAAEQLDGKVAALRGDLLDRGRRTRELVGKVAA